MDGHMGVDGICIWCGTRHGFTPEGDDKYTYYDNGKQVFGWFDLYDVRYSASRVTGIVIEEDTVLGGKQYFWNNETGLVLAIGSSMGSGYMCVESRTIGGVWYEFNEDGVCLGKKNN